MAHIYSCFIMILILTLPGTVLCKDYFSDPRLTRWAAMELEGKNTEVLHEVEKDLVSNKPFIFSPYIWVQLHGGGRYVGDAFRQIKNPKLSKALAQWQNIATLDHDERYEEALKKYPPAKFGRKTNPMILLDLQWEAMEKARYKDALQYAELALANGSDIFWIVWRTFNVFEEDERLRARFVARLKRGNVLHDKAAERFLLTMLKARPLTTEVMTTCIQEWLKVHPRDPFALLFLGMRLNQLGRYDEAAKIFEEATQIFPFITSKWDEHATVLRKLQRNDEADRVIIRSVQLGGFKDQEQMTGLRRYTVLSQFNEDEAYQLLDDLNKKWPDHEELTAARADLEIKLKRYSDALEFSEVVAKQNPQKIKHQVRLLKALLEAHRENEARSLYSTIRKTFPEITPELYEVAETLLVSEKDAPELNKLRREYSRQYPDSRHLPELKGDKLATAGRLDKAINEYRKLFAINAPTKKQLRKFAAMQRQKSGLPTAISALDKLVRRYPWEYHPSFLVASPPYIHPVTKKSELETDPNAFPRLVSQIGHNGTINALSLSPDKTLLASAGSDGVVILWHFETGKELRRFTHPQPVRAVGFIGDSLVTGADDGVVRVWNTATGIIVKEQKLLEGGIRTLALAPNGKSLLAGGASKTALLINFPEITVLARLSGHSASINAAVYAPDGRHVATASTDSSIRLWEVPSGKEALVLNGHKGAVTSLAFTHDGRFLASGSTDKWAILWHLASGVELADIKINNLEVQSLVFQPNSSTSILAGLEGGVIIQADFGKFKQQINRNYFKNTGNRAIVSFQGDRLLAAGDDGVIRELSLSSHETVRTLAGSTDSRPPAGFSPDGNYLVTSAGNGSVMLWSLNGNTEQTIIRPNEASDSVLWKFSDDGRYLAVYNSTGVIVIYDLTEHREIQRCTIKAPGVLSLMLSSSATSLATLHEDGTVRLWDARTGEQKGKISRVNPLGSPFTYTPDSSLLLVGSEDSIVYVVDSNTGDVLKKLEGHTRGIVTVAVSTDGNKVAFSSLDGKVTIWNIQTWKQEKKLDQISGAVVAMDFVPEEHTLVITAPEAPVSVIDIDSGKLRQLSESSTASDQLAFSGNGTYLLTGSRLSGERLWDFASSREIGSYKVDIPTVTGNSFSKNGAFVAVPGDGGVIRIINARKGAEVASLISFNDNTWAVVAPDGRFDTNNLEEIKGLHWVMPDDPFTPLPVEAFMREYYEPRLLAKLLADKPNLPPIKSPALLNRIQPVVTIDKIEPVVGDPTHVNLTLTARQVGRNGRLSGLADLRLFRDGQLVKYSDGNLTLTNDGRFTKTYTIHIPTAEDGRKQTYFTSYVFNTDRVKSATSKAVSVNRPEGKPERHAYIVAIGVGAYADSENDLEFPVADAASYSRELTKSLAATGRFTPNNIVPVLLTNNGTWQTGTGNERWAGVTVNLARQEIIHGVIDILAGRSVAANIRKEIPNSDRLMTATPEDLVIITFSGHGLIAPGKGGDFLLATADQYANEASMNKSFIASKTLANWLRELDAGDMALVIDACHSAASVDDQEFKPGPMGSRSLGQLAYDKGISILAATQAADVALEYDVLQHGLMTYVLVEKGLVAKKADFKPIDGKIDLKEWLKYGVETVPKIHRSLEDSTFKVLAKGINIRYLGRGSAQNKSRGIASGPSLQQPSLFEFRKQNYDLTLAK